MKRGKGVAVMSVLVLWALGGAGCAAPRYENRSEVPLEATWKLEDIYRSQALWEADVKSALSLSAELAEMKGHVMDSAASLWKTVDLDERIQKILTKVYARASMKSHEDTAAEGPKALADRAVQTYVKIGERTAFIAPEVLAGGQQRLDEFLKEEPRLEVYRLALKRILRQKGHILPAGEEAVLAAMGELAGAPDDGFSMLTDADMTFGEITDADGKKQRLTQESYGRYIVSPVRRVRQEAFEGIHRTFGKFRNTLGALYSASVKKDVAFARLRHYPSALEASLFGSEVPVEVYDGLIKAVHDNLPALHDYVALKKKALGVEHMEPYDLYAPFTKEIQRTFSYDRARELVLEAVAPLGEAYGAQLKKAYDGRWIDVYENKGKASGAYSMGCYGVHPYMLLNYGGTFSDVSTLAHESGHSMHTWLSESTQPFAYADYTLFVAEVASTVNEMLLAEYMMKHVKDRDEKIFLLNHQLEMIRTTIYRQTLFAEFERDVHAMAERGEPLTPEVMNRMWTELYRRYYGDEVASNADLPSEWSRIPHFYRAFYVYQYATSLSAAVAIVDGILNGGVAERDAYLNMLRGGSSADPIALLKGAGVDMSTPQPVDRALKVFARKLEELKELMDL